jgi:hypothetical protein
MSVGIMIHTWTITFDGKLFSKGDDDDERTKWFSSSFVEEYCWLIFDGVSIVWRL